MKLECGVCFRIYIACDHFLVSLAYDKLALSPRYLLSYTWEGETRLVTISSSLPCNNTIGTIQLDSKLITVHREHVVCFLPSPDLIIGIIVTLPTPPSTPSTYQHQHDNHQHDNHQHQHDNHQHQSLSLEELSKFRSIQIQHQSQYASFPLIPNKPTSLRFMGESDTPLWCQAQSYCEVVHTRWTVREDGVELEELDDRRMIGMTFPPSPFLEVPIPMTERRFTSSPTQFCMNLRELLSFLFPASRICHYSYVILQSTLCSPICPAPHLILAMEVVSAKLSSDPSPPSKRSCTWICLEIHFHPTNANPSWKMANQWTSVYATVLDRQKDGSFYVDRDHEERRRTEADVAEMEKQMAVKLLQKRLRSILPTLHKSEVGKPPEYSLRASPPTSTELHYVINMATDDVFVSSS